MKIIRQISRILIGITFIFSGFVKGIDPLGFSYKLHDYFVAMGLDWMVWSSLLFGVLVPFAEFAIGAAMLFNFKTKYNAWFALLFMIYFTGLTFWIALKNPVTDCGCFGDALIISNWATFYKNIVLITLAIIIFRYRKTFSNFLLPNRITDILTTVTILGYIGIVIYSYNHLPVFDFLPYKVGVNIPEAMKMPANAEKDVFKTTFYYKNKKTGEVKKFTEQNYPWQDTLNWAFDNSETKLIKSGYKPPIHDFSILTPQGDNIIDFYMYDDKFVFILVAYDIKKSSLKNQDKINKLATWCKQNNFPFICLTASDSAEIENYKAKTGAPYEFFKCDQTALKTIIRANPGLMLVKKGTIVKKWHHNDIQSPEEFQKEFLNK
jgi:hypothetical protein